MFTYALSFAPSQSNKWCLSFSFPILWLCTTSYCPGLPYRGSANLVNNAISNIDVMGEMCVAKWQVLIRSGVTILHKSYVMFMIIFMC